jgi:hypothetical protein
MTGAAGLPEAKAELQLPAAILARASVHYGEYAWPIEDIPAVIQAAKAARLVSLGGQLQFRLPDGGVCEAYHLDVGVYEIGLSTLPWADRVDETAREATAQFEELKARADFVAEGRGFRDVRDFEALGGDINSIMCFVWYVLAEPIDQ